MKKLILVITTAFMLTGCYKDDIDNLKDDINELKEQMAQYKNLLDALNNRLYITNYETKEGYYIITMSDGSQLSVRNTTSFIEIGENGNWIIDGTDTGKSAKGDTGDEGAAPEIVIGENGNWYINGIDTQTSASGENGKDGSDITSISLVNGIMTFTFADNRTISIEASVPKITILEPTNGFTIDKMKWFRIEPQVTNSANNTYKWLINNKEFSTELNLLYVFSEAGTYNIQFKAKNSVGETTENLIVTVNDKVYQNKITRVLEYFPAPGQFINTLPIATEEDTNETMRVMAEGKLTSNSMISLGGFGGYVKIGFDHTIINKEGNDFVILGNALSSWAEPGIIMVSYDANDNGIDDDEWYEIAGSEYNKPSTIKNYEITYFKPKSEPSGNVPDYISWEDNQGKKGYVSKNSFHSQSYYPLWKGESVTFKGTFLESNVYDTSGTGSYWVNPAYEWGYADNWGNNDIKGQIDISWAVNSNGKAVELKGIDFIKVYTSNRAEGGWLGEVSTEISGFKDLNLE
ncbi:PKD-like domain-containing protein [Confluentibacter sediminis]|uniref:PKD-like domain-containing protein n=1 Tax=Confluentibacter sediminis TaxID=2219045 RepID=UPI000DAC13F8|nr:PKD-like domain-containing protein [Confluentibacter sediminis]